MFGFVKRQVREKNRHVRAIKRLNRAFRTTYSGKTNDIFGKRRLFREINDNFGNILSLLKFTEKNFGFYQKK